LLRHRFDSLAAIRVSVSLDRPMSYLRLERFALACGQRRRNNGRVSAIREIRRKIRFISNICNRRRFDRRRRERGAKTLFF
jgi:hypothetical protein